MCRHLLPRFNLPASQVLHDVGRLASAHPAAAIAVLLAPTCALILFLACRHMLRRTPGGWHALRLAIPRGPSRAPDGRLRIAPSL